MELNFFEPLLREIKPEKQDKSKFIVAASLALFLAFVGTTLGYNFLETKKLNDEIAEADQFFNDDSIRVKVEEIDRKLAEISDIKLKEEYLSYLKQDMKNIDVINDRLLDFISKEVVKDLIIQELLIEKGAVTLQGISLTKLGIAQFEHDLRNSGHFYGIFVPKIEIEEGGFYSFEMSFDTVVGGQ